MIPVFFRRYKKAPLATCVSFMATFCFIIALFFSVGYVFNWEGMRSENDSLGESLLVAAVFAVVGIALWKLAAWLAQRKYDKMRATATPAATASATYVASSAATSTDARPAATRGGFCPKCGTKVEPGDAFCVNCGAKL